MTKSEGWKPMVFLSRDFMPEGTPLHCLDGIIHRRADGDDVRPVLVTNGIEDAGLGIDNDVIHICGIVERISKIGRGSLDNLPQNMFLLKDLDMLLQMGRRADRAG